MERTKTYTHFLTGETFTTTLKGCQVNWVHTDKDGIELEASTVSFKYDDEAYDDFKKKADAAWRNCTVGMEYQGAKYSIAQMREIFNRMCNQQDWKAPFMATMPGECVNASVAACIFMTGTVPTVKLDIDRMIYVLDCIGYRAGPCN